MTDSSKTPAARLDELTRLYERHAYVVWNLALRTALDDGPAADAARRAFAAQVQRPDERRLALDAARLAVDAAHGVDARSVEDPVLAATAHLAAVQRAVLALGELTDLSPATVAEKLGIEVERERQLRDAAYEQLGLLLAASGEDARVAYEDVPWAEPPVELWQALYPELHSAVTQHGEPSEPAPTAAVRKERKPARARGRRLRGAAVAGVAALAVAGVAWAATGGGGDSSGAGTQDYGGLPVSDDDASSLDDGSQSETGESSTSLLSPEELDKLRRNEIEQLKRLEQQKDDEQLPKQKRERAARKVNDLVKLAQARQRAAERRELELRRQLAEEREARMRERDERDEKADEPTPTEEQQPAQEPQDQDREPTGGQDGGGGNGGDDDPVETKCLYDPDNGTYICPE